MRRWALSLLPSLGLVFGAACGGSDSGTDGTPTTGSDAYALDGVCKTVPKTLCSDRMACCTTSGVAYDQAGCEAHETQVCESNVADVKAGKMTYDRAKVEVCLGKVSAFAAACKSDVASLLATLPTLADCAIFEGQKKEGEPCDRNEECARDPMVTSFAVCDETKHVCKLTRFAGMGEPCVIAEPQTLCKTGFACDFDQKTLGGFCVPQKAIGDACKPPLDATCGLGNGCDGATSKCVAGKAVGASTSLGGFDCASLKADASGKACAAPDPLFDAVDCSGKAP